MALINCPDCGTEVSDAAAACPKCARPITSAAIGIKPSPPGQKKKGVGVGFTLIVFAALAAWIYYQANTSDQSPAASASQVSSGPAQAAQSPPAQARPVFVTTPADLYRAYSTNEVATNQALAGKTIQFTAPVASIDEDFTNSAVLTFATGDQFNNLQATLKDGDKAASAQLTPGQVVTVRCASFQRIMDSPMGNDCTFLAASPSAAASTSPATATAPTPAAIVPDQDSSPVSASSGAQAAMTASSETSSPPAPPPSIATTPAGGASVSPVLQTVIAKTAGPSFDCTKATSATALAICGNAALSEIDRQMAILYYSRTDYAADQSVRDTQRAWIRNRNSCQADIACLRAAYSARIQQLQQGAPTPTT